jgi:acetate kinase
LERPLERLSLISCHLGGSSSVSAVKNGKSVENSMGFSAQAGVPMSKRCGDLDPSIIGFVMKNENLTFAEVMDILVNTSGLLGISGISGDLRNIEKSSRQGSYRATLALQAFTYQVKKYIGAYAAILGGVDALAFAGGIGENAPAVRSRICGGLAFLGIDIDGVKNQCQGTESIISKDNARVKVVVIPTNEELIVAREVCRVARRTTGITTV